MASAKSVFTTFLASLFPSLSDPTPIVLPILFIANLSLNLQTMRSCYENTQILPLTRSHYDYWY